MKKLTILIAILFISLAISAQKNDKQALPFKMEDLTSPKFAKAVELSGGICIIPLGIIEKHGPHLPLGTDLYEAREFAFQAAKREYAVVYPPYYFGQIFEARHQPGTMAYSNELIWKMLDETCKELSRNGMKKIILVNGHGGSTSFLQYCCQSQLARQEDYIVVLFNPRGDPSTEKEIKSLTKGTLDGHAGEQETSMMYYINPDFVDQEALKNESGLNQNRLSKLPNGYAGIWWYANFPNHFASDYNTPDKKLGELLITAEANQLVQLIKYLKTDNTIQQLQEEFFKKAQNPSGK